MCVISPLCLFLSFDSIIICVRRFSEPKAIIIIREKKHNHHHLVSLDSLVVKRRNALSLLVSIQLHLLSGYLILALKLSSRGSKSQAPRENFRIRLCNISCLFVPLFLSDCVLTQTPSMEFCSRNERVGNCTLRFWKKMSRHTERERQKRKRRIISSFFCLKDFNGTKLTFYVFQLTSSLRHHQQQTKQQTPDVISRQSWFGVFLCLHLSIHNFSTPDSHTLLRHWFFLLRLYLTFQMIVADLNTRLRFFFSFLYFGGLLKEKRRKSSGIFFPSSVLSSSSSTKSTSGVHNGMKGGRQKECRKEKIWL